MADITLEIPELTTVIAVGGDVNKVGTPVDDQIAVWTGDGTVEGSSGFNYNGSTLLLGENADGIHSIAGTSITSQVAVDSDGTADLGGLSIHRAGGVEDFGGHLLMLRSKGTHAVPLIVADNSVVGRVIGAGHDGVDFELAAEIQFLIDGAPGSNNMPGEIKFFTNAGSQVLVEQMAIRADGSIEFTGIITTGTWNGTNIAVANGGTGSSTAVGALLNLGLTSTAAEINLLDLAGLTVGWVLSADTATTASWKAPLGGGATWTKVTKLYTDWTAAATSEAENIFTLSAGAKLKGIVIKHTTAFAGTSWTETTIEVGISGETDRYALASDIFVAVGDTVFYNFENDDMQNWGSTTQVTATLKTVGGNISAGTAGAVEIYYLEEIVKS